MPKKPAKPTVGDLFSPTGPLSSAKPGYRERPQQVDLAREVAKTFRNKGVLFADAPTGTGKCLHGSTLVTLSDGSRRRIKDLVGLKPEIVQLGRDWKMGTGRVAACYESGVKNIFRLRTRLGHELTASADHPLLTITGWSRIRDVRLGMRIAAARKLEGLSSDEGLTNSELAFLGLMISDGGCSVLDAAYFTNTDPDIVDDLYVAARGVGNLVVKPQKRGKTYRIVRGPRQGMGQHVRNDAVVLLEKHGVLGRTALTKTIPEAIFSLSAGRLALFLGRLWSGDGCIEVARRVASYSSASETLMRQVQHLLLRLGVVARVRRHDGVCNGVRFPAWHLSVTEADNLRQFAETVGPHLVGPKATSASSERVVCDEL